MKLLGATKKAKKATSLLMKIVSVVFIANSLFAQSKHIAIVSESGWRPYIVSDQDGCAHVAWEEKVPTTDSYELYPFYAKFDKSGQKITETIQLMNELYNRYPRIIPGRDKILGLFDYVFPGSMETWMYGQFYDFNGNKNGGLIDFYQGNSPSGFGEDDTTFKIVWAMPDQIVGTTCSVEYLGDRQVLVTRSVSGTKFLQPKIFKNKSNNTYALTWVDNSSGSNQIYIRILRSDWSQIGEEYTVCNDTTVKNIYYYGATMDSAGYFSVAWAGSRNGIWQIYRKNFDSSAVPYGDIDIVATNIDSVNSYTYANIATNKNGESVVVWEGKVNKIANIFMQRFDKTHAKIGSSINCSQSALQSYEPNVCFEDSSIYVTWWDVDNSKSRVMLNVLDYNNPLDGIVPSRIVQSNKSSFVLHQNYPNPFNPSTTISFEVLSSGTYQVVIYNAMGKIERSLLNKYLPAGTYNTIWNGMNDAGIPVPSGIYFCRISNALIYQSTKMLLIK